MADKPSRDALLARVTRRTPAKALPSRPDARTVDDLGWDELGRLVEGMVWAQRPIRAAAHAITQQHDLGPRGAFILSLIEGGLVFPHELATALRIGRSLITAELVRLTEAGLVTATPGKQDRRRSELALTPSGHAACEAVRTAMARIIRRNLTGFSADEVRRLTTMLLAVSRLTDDEREP